MTGTSIVLREECLSTFRCCQSYHYQTIASVRSQLSIVLDAAPLELIISLQHTITKLLIMGKYKINVLTCHCC